jgi:hypothetical protein
VALSPGLDVLVVVEDVVRVVLGLDFGESPVDPIAVCLSNPAGVVVGIEEVDVDAAGAVRLEGLEEPPRPSGLGRGVLVGFLGEPHGVDDDVVSSLPPWKAAYGVDASRSTSGVPNCRRARTARSPSSTAPA